MFKVQVDGEVRDATLEEIDEIVARQGLDLEGPSEAPPIDGGESTEEPQASITSWLSGLLS